MEADDDGGQEGKMYFLLDKKVDSDNSDEACADAAKDNTGAAAVFATAREKFAIWRLLRTIGDEICQGQKHMRRRYQVDLALVARLRLGPSPRWA